MSAYIFQGARHRPGPGQTFNPWVGKWEAFLRFPQFVYFLYFSFQFVSIFFLYHCQVGGSQWRPCMVMLLHVSSLGVITASYAILCAMQDPLKTMSHKIWRRGTQKSRKWGKLFSILPVLEWLRETSMATPLQPDNAVLKCVNCRMIANHTT